MEILSIKDLNFTYRTNDMGDNDFLLKSLNFTLHSGDFVLLCGSSGCGKTTLLRIIKSSLMPAGTMTGDVCRFVPDEKIGFVFQQPDSQTIMEKVFDELIFGCENLGFSTDRINKSLSEITAFFGIEHLLDRECTNLSGGEKQLVNLASVMMTEPDVLIFDEPLSQLDPIASTYFLNIIGRLHRELGIAIIMCEHNLTDILPVCTRICFMNNGTVTEFLTPHDFISYAISDEKNYTSSLPPLVQAAVRCNVKTDKYPLSVRDFRMLDIPENTLKCYLQNTYNISVKENIPDNIDSVSGKSKHDLAVYGKKLYFRYSKHEADVIDNLSINIPKNSIYAIIGGNGAGKSTLLSLLSGFNTPYMGKLSWENKTDICYLPQNPLYLLKENMLFNDYSNLLHKIKADKVKYDMIKELLCSHYLFRRLEKHIAQPASLLSGGELQIAGLLYMHLLDRGVWLLDEPTKGLDGEAKENLAIYINDLKNDGKTIITVSHDLEFISRNASYCGMMFKGKMAAEGTCGEILQNNNFYTASILRALR